MAATATPAERFKFVSGNPKHRCDESLTDYYKTERNPAGRWAANQSPAVGVEARPASSDEGSLPPGSTPPSGEGREAPETQISSAGELSHQSQPEPRAQPLSPIVRINITLC